MPYELKLKRNAIGQYSALLGHVWVRVQRDSRGWAASIHREKAAMVRHDGAAREFPEMKLDLHFGSLASARERLPEVAEAVQAEITDWQAQANGHAPATPAAFAVGQPVILRWEVREHRLSQLGFVVSATPQYVVVETHGRRQVFGQAGGWRAIGAQWLSMDAGTQQEIELQKRIEGRTELAKEK